MQTFLPYNDFKKTAACLDNRRLGKQRVEAYQILRIISGKRTSGGWMRHPAVLMWKGFSDALAAYQNSMIAEWIDRGFNNTMELAEHEEIYKLPPFMGANKFHESHRSNLLRKDFEFYSKFGWNVPNNLPYVWPVTT